jgi:hypothetical protein
MTRRSKIADANPAAGTAPDATVAAAVGCRESEVWAYRKRRDIPPFRPPAAPVVRSLVADMPAWVALLGTASDSEIARRYGVAYTHVRKLRIHLGIARWSALPEPKSERIPPADPPYADLLGTMPDAEIGRRYGLTRARIHQHRKKRCIPAFKP